VTKAWSWVKSLLLIQELKVLAPVQFQSPKLEAPL
jgi:hypothetical protein